MVVDEGSRLDWIHLALSVVRGVNNSFIDVLILRLSGPGKTVAILCPVRCRRAI